MFLAPVLKVHLCTNRHCVVRRLVVWDVGRRGEKVGAKKKREREREKRKGGKGQRVKVGGVCLLGCGTVIQPRGVAVVFLIEIQQMWERKVG